MVLALEINDAGLIVAGAEGPLLEGPGFAVLDDGRVLIGAEARARAWLDPGRVQHDFWLRLDTSPLPGPGARARTRADLVYEHLRQLWEALGEPAEDLVLAVPGCYRREQLALLLGILQRLSINVVGLVDAAVAATRRAYPWGELFYLDMDLHRTVITPLTQGGQLSAGEPRILDQSGVLAAERAMTRAIAAEFVNQTRFDPLHQAAGEQQLHDRLPKILQGLQGASVVDVVMSAEGGERRAKLGNHVLVSALRQQAEHIAKVLKGLGPTNRPSVVQLSHRLADLPGLLETLTATFSEVIVLERGAAAKGVREWAVSFAVESVPLPFVRTVPLPAPASEPRDPSKSGSTAEPGSVPTHVLVGDTAHVLDSDDLEIGRDPPTDCRSVRMLGDQPGVSRRHCSIRLQQGGAVLRDHSRFGTWLNDRKAPSEVALRVGDRIRLGEAAQELRLIRVMDP